MTSVIPPVPDIAPSDGRLRGSEATSAVRRAFSSPIASAVVIVISVLWTIPTLGLFINSFRSKEDAATTGWWEFFVHPSFSLAGYEQVLTGSGGLALPLVNSLAITIPATIIPIFIASMAAYSLAWLRFRGSDAIFFLIFALQIIPSRWPWCRCSSTTSRGCRSVGSRCCPPPASTARSPRSG